MKKILLMLCILFLTGCGAVEIGEPAMSNPISYKVEYFRDKQKDPDTYLPGDFSNRGYDAAFYKIENGKESLLTNSIIDSSTELNDYEALFKFAEPSNGTIIFSAGIVYSDSVSARLYAYNEFTKTFKPFTEGLIILGMQRSPKQNMASFIGENAIRIFDLIALQELDPIKIPEGEFINNPTLDGLGPNMFPPMEWLDESTFKYSTFKQDGTLTQERIINF